MKALMSDTTSFCRQHCISLRTLRCQNTPAISLLPITYRKHDNRCFEAFRCHGKFALISSCPKGQFHSERESQTFQVSSRYQLYTCLICSFCQHLVIDIRALVFISIVCLHPFKSFVEATPNKMALALSKSFVCSFVNAILRHALVAALHISTQAEGCCSSSLSGPRCEGFATCTGSHSKCLIRRVRSICTEDSSVVQFANVAPALVVRILFHNVILILGTILDILIARYRLQLSTW